MDNSKIELYEGFSLAELYKQALDNSRDNRTTLINTVMKLSEFLKTIVDVQLLSPEIANYMNIIVKNDEILVKIASIAAKVNTASLKSVSGEDNGLSEAEKQLLIKQASSDLQSILDDLRQKAKDPTVQ